MQHVVCNCRMHAAYVSFYALSKLLLASELVTARTSQGPASKAPPLHLCHYLLPRSAPINQACATGGYVSTKLPSFDVQVVCLMSTIRGLDSQQCKGSSGWTNGRQHSLIKLLRTQRSWLPDTGLKL